MDAPCCCGAGKAWQTADKQGGGLQGSTRAQRHGDVGAEGRATHDCMRAHVIGPARHKQGSEQADQRERKGQSHWLCSRQPRPAQTRCLNQSAARGTRSVLPGTPRRSPPAPPSPEVRPGCWRQPDGLTCQGRWRDGENRGQKGEMEANEDGRPGAAARDSRGARAERTSATAGDASTRSIGGD